MQFYRGLQVALLMLMFFVTICAEAGVAKVLSVSGKVTLTRNGQERALSRGADLEVGDLIRTASGATTQMKYTNGTLITLKEGTLYKTLSYVGEVLESQVDSGVMDYKSTGGKKGKIQTPVVALAILGTEFTIVVTLETTGVEVIEGLVQGGNVVIGPGQQFNSGTFSTGGSFNGGEFNATPGSDSGGTSSGGSGQSSGSSAVVAGSGTPTEVAVVSNDIVATSSTAQIAAEASVAITPPVPPTPPLAEIELVFPQ